MSGVGTEVVPGVSRIDTSGVSGVSIDASGSPRGSFQGLGVEAEVSTAEGPPPEAAGGGHHKVDWLESWEARRLPSGGGQSNEAGRFGPEVAGALAGVESGERRATAAGISRRRGMERPFLPRLVVRLVGEEVTCSAEAWDREPMVQGRACEGVGCRRWWSDVRAAPPSQTSSLSQREWRGHPRPRPERQDGHEW